MATKTQPKVNLHPTSKPEAEKRTVRVAATLILIGLLIASIVWMVGMRRSAEDYDRMVERQNIGDPQPGPN